MDSPGESIDGYLKSKSKPVDALTICNETKKEKRVDDHTKMRSVENINGTKYDQKNPLENPLVISHVFQLLNVADLKECRLVCTKWNALAIPLVEKMSITIIGSSFTTTVPDRSLTSFNDVAENSMITYQSFKLNSSPGCRIWWSFTALEKILQDQDVRELTIDDIKIRRPRNHPEPFIINKFIDDKFTHFSVNNTRSRHSFVVSTANLASLNSLSFKNCRLDTVDENCLLAPQKFEMLDVEVFKNQRRVNNFSVHEILTFENLKDLTLSSEASHSSKLVIDLASKVTVDNLFLHDVNVENFYESKWCIAKTLTLVKVQFLNSTQMHFTELYFGGSTINVNSLSESIEKLTLDFCADNAHIVQQPEVLALKNLKYLELVTDSSRRHCIYCPHQSSVQDRSKRTLESSPLRFLNLFGSCLNLATVKLTAYDDFGAPPPTDKNFMDP